MKDQVDRHKRRGPRGLSPRARRLWNDVMRDFDLDSAREAVLVEALRSLDRADQLRRIVEAEGPIVRDRWSVPKMHPAAMLERDSRAAAIRAFDVLGLELEGGIDAY